MNPDQTLTEAGARSGFSRVQVIAVAAIAIAAAVLGGLFATGAIPLGSHGPAGTQDITPKAPQNFSVVFWESGLAGTTDWSVSLGGSTQSGGGPSLSFNEPNGTYPFVVRSNSSYVADPATGNLTVSGQPVNRTIDFSVPYRAGVFLVSFTETGLPAGVSWSVQLNGTTLATNTSAIEFRVRNGTYPFLVTPPSGYTGVPASGSAPVQGSNLTEPIAFFPSTDRTYVVTFTETGLPTGTSWSLTLGGAVLSSISATLTVSEPNGVYAFSVGGEPGYDASPPSGSVTVAGHATSVRISFNPLPVYVSDFNVTFVENGLPPGTAWGATLVDGSTGAYFSGTSEGGALVLAVPNGTYAWSPNAVSPSMVSNQSSGTVVVAGGPRQVDIGWRLIGPATVAYPVEFTESGLPAGTPWTVNLTSSNATSVSSTLNISLVNGTYPWFANSSGSWTVFSGLLTVDGGPARVSVLFFPTYQVTFRETGLPSGDGWQVYVDGIGTGTSGTEINFSLQPGAHFYQIGGDESPFGPQYVASPPDGNFTVSSAGSTVDIRFHAATGYNVVFYEQGLPSAAPWNILVFPTPWFGYGFGGTSSSENFTLPNGSFGYQASTYGGNVSYVPSPLVGSFTVSGGDVQVTVQFLYRPAVHPVEFFLVPLANTSFYLGGSTNWSVTIGTDRTVAVDDAVLVALPNGTYNFSVQPPAGYVAYPGSGTFTVNDSTQYSFPIAGLYFDVSFTPAPGIPRDPAHTRTLGPPSAESPFAVADPRYGGRPA